MKFEKSIAVLYSENITESLRFFKEKLGFDEGWEWDKPATFGGNAKDGVEVFFSTSKEVGISNARLFIVLDNVDELYASIKDKGVKIHLTPTSQKWNMREIIIETPDGHIITFGHRTDCE